MVCYCLKYPSAACNWFCRKMEQEPRRDDLGNDTCAPWPWVDLPDKNRQDMEPGPSCQLLPWPMSGVGEVAEAMVLILGLLCVPICPLRDLHAIPPSPVSLSSCPHNMPFGEDFFSSSFTYVLIKTVLLSLYILSSQHKIFINYLCISNNVPWSHLLTIPLGSTFQPLHPPRKKRNKPSSRICAAHTLIGTW